MRLTLHEWVFGAYLVLSWLFFSIRLGPLSPAALVFPCLLAVDAALIAACRRKPDPRRWTLRLLFHPLAMNVCYLLMGSAVPAATPWMADGLLQRADALLVGGNLSLRVEPLIRPWLTDLMSLCYALFIPYLAFSMIRHLAGDLRTAVRFFTGLFVLYGIGFLGYTFIPALGPYLAMAGEFKVPLEAGWPSRLNAWVVGTGSNRVDVFPSLHCAGSAYLLLFDRTHKPWRYRLYLLPCIGLWLSTIYLRYHYFVDMLFGGLLAALCLRLAATAEVPERPNGRAS